MIIRLSKDKELVDTIKKALKNNDGYCPCRMEKNEDTKCMCKDFRDQVDRHEEGTCHCGLFEYSEESLF